MKPNFSIICITLSCLVMFHSTILSVLVNKYHIGVQIFSFELEVINLYSCIEFQWLHYCHSSKAMTILPPHRMLSFLFL